LVFAITFTTSPTYDPGSCRCWISSRKARTATRVVPTRGARVRNQKKVRKSRRAVFLVSPTGVGSAKTAKIRTSKRPFQVGERADDEIRDATREGGRGVAPGVRRLGFAGFAPRYRVRDARARARRRTEPATPRSPDRSRSDLRPVPNNVAFARRGV
jgi:hypothetical protein